MGVDTVKDKEIRQILISWLRAKGQEMRMQCAKRAGCTRAAPRSWILPTFWAASCVTEIRAPRDSLHRFLEAYMSMKDGWLEENEWK